MGARSKINLEDLADEISRMERHNPLFKVLKQALSKRGYWKNKKRGNPRKGYGTGFGKYKR